MANTYIEYAKGGTDYRTKSTISCWVKRGSLGVQQDIWSFGENNSSDSYCRFDTADNLEMHCDGADGTFNTTSLFRDTNAWYHIVFSLDGSNSTANLRRRLWINGVQINEGKGSISTFSTAIQGNHSVQDLWIGGRARSQQSGATEYFNGIISHFHYCSNYSYAASDFGSFDSTSGEWKINTSPNVQYGSEGFFLKMENSSNMDLDSSGNNKTLTTSGTLTKTEDCPSNVFATLNGAFNLSDNVLSYGNNKVVNANSNWKYVPATLGASSGKWYAEYKNTIGSGYLMVGVVDMQYATSQDVNSYTHSGAGTGSVSIYDNGEKYIQGSNTTYAASYGSGTIIGVALDMDNGKVYFSKNGAWATGSGAWGSSTFNSAVGAITLPTTGTYTFAVSQRSGAYNETNFGNGKFGTTSVSSAGTNASGIGIFEYDVPTGYTALSTKGLNS